MGVEPTISIQVCYAKADQQEVITVTLPLSSNAEQAINVSGILSKHPEIDLTVNSIGICGQHASLAQGLHAHDRIEIYRPLQQPPMAARRHRAEQEKP